MLFRSNLDDVYFYENRLICRLVKVKTTRLLQGLGPGILFASTAIGVSHLVQSTRAGADFGYGLLWAILAANFFKYPFFEFGSRYASCTGKSIIRGYKEMHPLLFGLYILIMLFSMFFVAAAVGAVTAGFVVQLFGLTGILGAQTGLIITAVLFLVCGVILWLGKYSSLDRGIKILGSFLLISTLLAFAMVVFKDPASTHLNSHLFFFPESENDWFFLLALMGWMPTAVDLSAWNSLWTIEKHKSLATQPNLKETLFDFRLGYVISSILALCFLTLGAKMLFGSETALPDKASLFASEIVGMYSNVMGDWSVLVIGVAACSIMLGTCIAVFDGYARSVEEIGLVGRNSSEPKQTRLGYKMGLILILVGAFFIILLLAKSLTTLVDIATCISFLVAPIIAVANYSLVMSNALKKMKSQV